MAKPIKFIFKGAALEAQLESKIEKADLYGKSRMIVEKDGVILSKGALLPTGELLRKEEVRTLQVDPEGSPAGALRTLVNGVEQTQVVSSLKRDNPLKPVPLSSLVGFNVTDVFPINGLTLEKGLYETTFNYRDSYEPRLAYLLVKEQAGSGQAFLLSGSAKQTTFLDNVVTYEFFEQEGDPGEGEDEDLSFGMV